MVFCFVVGTEIKRSFEVSGDDQMTISKLKEIIHERIKNNVKNIDANSLDLWKVDIPDDKAKVTLKTLESRSDINNENIIIKEIGGEELSPFSNFGDISTCSSRNIRIIVQPPLPVSVEDIIKDITKNAPKRSMSGSSYELEMPLQQHDFESAIQNCLVSGVVLQIQVFTYPGGSSDLKDEKETKSEAEFTSDVENDIENFAVRLGLDEFTKNNDEWKKFYDFAGSCFVWPQPPTDINERRLIFDYVIDPDWDPIGEELAKNALEYRRLLESDTLDPSQGTHILIVNGNFVRYGSSEEAKETMEEYPGCFYVPIKEHTVKVRRFSATDDDRGWQATLRISSK